MWRGSNASYHRKGGLGLSPPWLSRRRLTSVARFLVTKGEVAAADEPADVNPRRRTLAERLSLSVDDYYGTLVEGSSRNLGGCNSAP
eukprot:SAG22_NODE_4942_length_1124_cov_5.812683_2_plen_87_part_00